jgi:hypothetical protein
VIGTALNVTTNTDGSIKLPGGFTIPKNDFVDANSFNTLVNNVITGELFGNITFVSFNTSDIKKIMKEVIEDLLDFKLDLKVKTVLDSPKGKWPENLGSVVFIENDFFFKYIREDMIKKLDKAVARVI